MYTEDIGDSFIFRLNNLAYLRFEERSEYDNTVQKMASGIIYIKVIKLGSGRNTYKLLFCQITDVNYFFPFRNMNRPNKRPAKNIAIPTFLDEINGFSHNYLIDCG